MSDRVLSVLRCTRQYQDILDGLRLGRVGEMLEYRADTLFVETRIGFVALRR